MNAHDWKNFYAREREALGEKGFCAILDRATHVEFPDRGALIFPHTRLSQSGHLVAGAARAVVDCGAKNVLALGVLHRRNREDESERRIHGPQVEEQEFSLDNFRALVDLYSRQIGQVAPNIIARFPFQTGTAPRSLPGFDELKRVAETSLIVATADPVHHGAGYNWSVEEHLARESNTTRETAQAWITEAFEALHTRDYESFQSNANRVRSDFRDVGPVLAELIDFPNLRSQIIDLELVDYSDVLQAPEPTWVAAALVRVNQVSSTS